VDEAVPGSTRSARNLEIRPGYNLHRPQIQIDDSTMSTRSWRFAASTRTSRVAAFNRLVGESKAMVELRARISRFAKTEATVLILGETGTGKSLIARALHDLSSRNKGPFVAVNCAAIPGSLAENELFGSIKGAYTGAIGRRHGLLSRANGGTLFLDEFGELTVEIQSKFLRTLESGFYRPLGCNREQRADIRIIAATNRDLERSVLVGDFRADLYYRINVLQILAPPLRTHRSDIPLIIAAIFDDLLPENGTIRVTDAVMSELTKAPWSGNVRELKNFLRRSLAMSDGQVIDSLEPSLGQLQTDFPVPHPRPKTTQSLMDALSRNCGRLDAVAKELNVSVRTVQRRMKRAGLRIRDFRTA